MCPQAELVTSCTLKKARNLLYPQAAPFVPGDSKAGASQEGWTEDQIEKILEEEKIWKQQVAAKEVPTRPRELTNYMLTNCKVVLAKPCRVKLPPDREDSGCGEDVGGSGCRERGT